MIYPCDKDVLQDLLKLIKTGKYHQALQAWSSYRHDVAQVCPPCPYGEVRESDDCCLCLESKLLTLSLYEHGDGFDQELLEAARKLEVFKQQTNLAAH